MGAVLSLVALLACFADPGFRPGVWGVVLFVGAMVVYFFLYSRHRLVARAPEEENALLTQALQEIAPAETLGK